MRPVIVMYSKHFHSSTAPGIEGCAFKFLEAKKKKKRKINRGGRRSRRRSHNGCRLLLRPSSPSLRSRYLDILRLLPTSRRVASRHCRPAVAPGDCDVVREPRRRRKRRYVFRATYIRFCLALLLFLF